MRKKGFTLIELLVVIAIIGVVAALLMPSLREIRKKALFVACRSNLNQVGIAMNNYLDDYDCFPAIAAVDSAQNDDLKLCDPDTGKPTLAGALAEYLGNPEVLKCPSDRGYTGYRLSSNGKSCYDAWGTSFEYNTDMYSSRDTRAPGYAKDVTQNYVSTLRLPSVCILMHDFTGDPGMCDLSWHSIGGNPAYNVMFLDLHVEPVCKDDGQQAKTYFMYHRMWWRYGRYISSK